MKRTLLALSLLLCAGASSARAQGSERPLLLQKPTLSRTQIVFSYAGDLWSVPREGGDAVHLTTGTGIETDPTFSPDGQWIAFTSDRGGSPQIYKMPAGGGAAQRLTFEGSYNVGPRFSPDGRFIVYVQRDGGRYRIASLELSTGQVQVLTDGTFDDSPSYAPNGKMILYEAQVGGRGQLAAVSGDGRVRQRLSSSAGDIQDPAWGPMPTN